MKGTADNTDSPTPEEMRRNSNEYLKFKLQKTEEMNKLVKAHLAAENELNLIIWSLNFWSPREYD